MKLSMVIVYAIAAAIVVAGEIRIKGRVRKRYNAHRWHRAAQPPCSFNETIIEDEWSLMEAIGKSKYIFTGKVLSVKKFKSEGVGRSNLYRVHLRRVLKGSLSDLRMFVKLEGSQESLSGSTLVVERKGAREACAPGPRPQLSAIFLSNGEHYDGGKGAAPRLELLTDPVPLTLFHLDRINAAVKGSLRFHCEPAWEGRTYYVQFALNVELSQSCHITEISAVFTTVMLLPIPALCIRDALFPMDKSRSVNVGSGTIVTSYDTSYRERYYSTLPIPYDRNSDT